MALTGNFGVRREVAAPACCWPWGRGPGVHPAPQGCCCSSAGCPQEAADILFLAQRVVGCWSQPMAKKLSGCVCHLKSLASCCTSNL